MDDTDHYRCRLIYLKPGDNTSCQADAACEAIAGIEGIILAAALDEHSVHIIYSLNNLSFELLVDLLDELGFETDNSILLNLRKTIFQFLEENARDNLQINITEFEPGEQTSSELPPETEDKYWKDYH